jgi:hypothetical protein
MKKQMLLASALAVTILSSCSKTLILSDGQNTKKIKVATSIQVKHDEANNAILSFESVQGTKYSINTANYSYEIK